MPFAESHHFDAVLPAGGRVDDKFAVECGQSVKAMIDFGGRSLLRRAIESVAAIEPATVGRIVVVGPRDTHNEALDYGADEALDDTGAGSANILRGIDWLTSFPDHAARILIVTTDMPFISSSAIIDFVSRCSSDVAVCVPLIERTEFESKYPGLIRTDTRLSDGWFRLGGVFLVEADLLTQHRAQLTQVFEARKNNLALARLIGFSTLFRYLTRRLSSEDIVKRAGEILSSTGKVIKDAQPELGFDIDLPEEYRYAVAQFISHA